MDKTIITLSKEQIASFRNVVWQYYLDNKRPMPWREDTRPYYILVSEIMLQQTQVTRVIEKFNQFITRFPDIKSLAESPLSDVLSMWSGLGYNRRAKYLKQCAEVVHTNHNGRLPQTLKELISLPGIGKATAAAILNYAFEIPTPYVETNVRTVYFHHFFKDCESITDTALIPYIEQCHDQESPQEWCWAIMDYGTYLKKTIGNLNIKSKHYSKQSKFEGSHRQKRGKILKQLLQQPASVGDLAHSCKIENAYAIQILDELMAENMVSETKGRYQITD